MLRVTIDIFSGRPNPSFVMVGPESDEVLKQVSRNRGVIADRDAGYAGLGYRGVHVELLSDEVAGTLNLPADFKIGGGGATDDGRSFDLAERLIRSMRKFESTSSVTDRPLEFNEDLEKYILEQFNALAPLHGQTTNDGGGGPQPALEDVTCMIEKGKFNPGFWNVPNVQPYNNCYNYASNFRTNTFAQPGKGAGSQYAALTCPEVTRAALADGCHRRFDCFPDPEKPRWLVALVVAPGRDYHWYRIQQEGFWGHKPGSTPAKNTDNNGAVITSPETCARAPYTDFCGYFYSCTTQQHRIK
jgi:hypothetical protein